MPTNFASIDIWRSPNFWLYDSINKIFLRYTVWCGNLIKIRCMLDLFLPYTFHIGSHQGSYIQQLAYQILIKTEYMLTALVWLLKIFYCFAYMIVFKMLIWLFVYKGSTDCIVCTTTGVNDPVTSALHIILGRLNVC